MKRLLVVGAGSIGERHARSLLSTGRFHVGICEINATLRAAVAERYPLAGAFALLEEALDHAWDMAIVATPAPTHVPIALALAERGIHLMVEKPVSTSLDGVDRLLSAVEARGLVAATGYVLRAYPALARLREAVAEGRIGRPLQLVMVCGQSFPTFRPAYREIYYSRRDQGGGAIQDALTHSLNAGEWCAGPIERIIVDAAHQRLEGVTVEDTAHALARHGGLLANYALNQYQASNEWTMSVVGEQGMARCDLLLGRWRWKTDPDGPAGEAPWHEEYCPLSGRDEPFARQGLAFLEACETGVAPLCTLREGVQTLRANLAALRSLDNGGWEDVTSR